MITPQSYEELCFCFTIGQATKYGHASVSVHDLLTRYTYEDITIAVRSKTALQVYPQLFRHTLACKNHQNEIMALLRLRERLVWSNKRQQLLVMSGLHEYPCSQGIAHSFTLA